MNAETKQAVEQQVRLNLALKAIDKSNLTSSVDVNIVLKDLEAIFKWVMGPQTTIVPVNNLQVIQ